MNSIILILFAYCTWMGTVIAGDIKNTGEIRRNAVHICSREIIECPEIDGPDSLYEPLEDCTKFCQCSNGIAYVHNCSSGLHFNPVLNVCDYPERAGCDGGIKNESSNEDSDGESGNEIEENGIDRNGCQLQCPEIDGPDSIYGPLEDCTKFCQCSNGIAYVHNCSSGLHFNPVLNVCDYPDRAGCDGGAHNESGEDNSNQESGNEIEENGISANGCQLHCPDIDGPDSIYAPLEDCTKFCQCSNGIAHVHNCSSGLHFNPVLNVCDYPDRAGCDGGTHNESGEDNSNQESGNEIEENGISANGCQLQCPDIDGPDSIYGPLEDCTKFCQCSNGIAYVHNCSSGLHFNPVLNVCDYPDRAGCDGGAHNESGEDNSNQESGNEIEENGISANGCQLQCPDIDGPDSIYAPLEDCTKFCQCSNGIAHVHNCSSGLHFNPVLNVCDYPDRAGCDGGTHNESGEDNSNQESGNEIDENGISANGCQLQCPDIDGPDSIYGPLEDCTKFCQCSNGIAHVHNCSSGLHFNPVLNVCDYPDRAGCDGGTHNESGEDNSNQESENAIEENGISTNGCQLQCPDIDGPDSIYGPLEDCTKFCQCSNGIAYVHNCSSGLHFNPVLNVCDYPDRAGCDGGTHNESEDNSNQESENEIEEDGISTNGCQLQCPDIDGPDSIYGPLEDCTKFCQCSNGIAHVHNCSSGLHFNPVLNICDYPDRAGCYDGSNSNGCELGK
ncbi:unnamed protein product [Phaedon cochleariae]|uniref:Chitin-binding type-2 domain-containing protein n=1 Tax=Phaedon cochleariae TaxID=80249 RepID=A0A9N9S970_PHACE|nr:unnamed protein product [Phaedon cochleariae]